MKNSIIKVQLNSLKSLRVMVFTSMPIPNDLKFLYFKEGENPVPLKLIKTTSTHVITLYDLELPSDYQFGSNHYLSVTSFPAQLVETNNAIYFPEFDNIFSYDGNDLGAVYTKEETRFAVWAPLASKVVIKLEEGKDKFVEHEMIRTDRGVYRYIAKGDFINARYTYLVTNDGVTREACDPYGKGASTNSKRSAVVDYEAIRNMEKYIPTNKIDKYVNSVVYEVNVRDFTEQEDTTDIVNKGKYLGFVERGRKTKKGHPAGLDYLVDIGITHVQLNPIVDFGSVDDLNQKAKYNWGYDPISMFAIEGSYSNKPEIPQERLIEFRTMVDELHKSNIRVIMDVVYNHVFEYMTSCYEKIVPQYFFRRCFNGNIANASGCGDDVASERHMVRKMIVDSTKYFIDTFDVDGFRFDLMGLTDVTTINKCLVECRNIKKDTMIYGEGWNMGDLPFEEKACSDNAAKLPEVGFFNELFRDIVKGSTFDMSVKGFVGGDINYAYGLRHVIYGSCLDCNYNAKFVNANQSINYVECHDNNTLYDKLIVSNSEESEVTILKRIKLANGIVAFAIGVPFFHMGQEIGQSKKGNGNTYNVLDINKMRWDLIDRRYSMVEYFKSIIQVRKMFDFCRPSDCDKIPTDKMIEQDNCIYLLVENPNIKPGYDAFAIVFNPNNETINKETSGNDVIVLDGDKLLDKYQQVNTLVIPPVSCMVLARKENK